MFETEYTLYNEIKVLKSIKYSESYIKHTSKFLITLILGFCALTLTLLLFHFLSNIPLFLSIMFGFLAMCFIPYCITRHKDIKMFRIDFNDENVNFISRNKTMVINYCDLKLCGLIRRAGSHSLTSILLDQPSNDTDDKNMFVFVAKESGNLKRLVWHMRTSTGICHSYKKGMFCICDYRGSPVFEQCFVTVKNYCSKYSVEIINKDRRALWELTFMNGRRTVPCPPYTNLMG